MELLGLSPACFLRVRMAASSDEAAVLLQDLKDRARKAYKKQAVLLHPDRNNGDADKTSTLVGLNALIARIEKLHVAKRAPLYNEVPQYYSNTSPTGGLRVFVNGQMVA